MQARQNGDLLDLRELPPPGKTALLRRMESFREYLEICRPAATMDTISFTIRKPSKNARKVEDDDFDDLFSRGQNRRRKPELIEELLALKDAGNWREFFRAARMARMNIGLCGRTG